MTSFAKLLRDSLKQYGDRSFHYLLNRDFYSLSAILMFVLSHFAFDVKLRNGLYYSRITALHSLCTLFLSLTKQSPLSKQLALSQFRCCLSRYSVY